MLRHSRSLRKSGARGWQITIPHWLAESWGVQDGTLIWLRAKEDSLVVTPDPPGQGIAVQRPVRRRYSEFRLSVPPVFVESYRFDVARKLTVEVSETGRELIYRREEK